MKVKFILPALTEAKSPFWRPVKYSLFPPLGLATLAAFLSPTDEAELIDDHVEPLHADDAPDLVVIQVYITNAYRAYALADHYRAKGCFVALGGLHVPNSIVVTRGCPQHCDFCYKDAFFAGGRSFYTQRVDDALAEIDRLPGRHLYFLDDHLLGNRRFAEGLFEGMRGMRRLFQGAATVDSVLRGDLIERAAGAGLRSLFVGFETFSPLNLQASNKKQNRARDYEAAVQRLSDLGIMINGSFVFGMDDDDSDVFGRTVDWAVRNGLTTATFHIQTPYPGTRLYDRLAAQGRITCHDWDRYDTRHVVYRPAKLTEKELKLGYDRAYSDFYGWKNIARASLVHDSLKHRAKHFFYSAGWKKFEPLWNLVIKTRHLASMTPLLEAVLSQISGSSPIRPAADAAPQGPRSRACARESAARL
ncbi:Radical SAM superfamily protein [Rhizobiales bacterium GAS191]|nr:Radical SAM superfamily protein [Rhizobiales bacterium GAS113]SEE25849.1 Radical SAM superfamily protein [Rhizobiales bacterium GAS191]